MKMWNVFLVLSLLTPNIWAQSAKEGPSVTGGEFPYQCPMDRETRFTCEFRLNDTDYEKAPDKVFEIDYENSFSVIILKFGKEKIYYDFEICDIAQRRLDFSGKRELLEGAYFRDSYEVTFRKRWPGQIVQFYADKTQNVLSVVADMRVSEKENGPTTPMSVICFKHTN